MEDPGRSWGHFFIHSEVRSTKSRRQMGPNKADLGVTQRVQIPNIMDLGPKSHNNHSLYPNSLIIRYLDPLGHRR